MCVSAWLCEMFSSVFTVRFISICFSYLLQRDPIYFFGQMSPLSADLYLYDKRHLILGSCCVHTFQGFISLESSLFENFKLLFAHSSRPITFIPINAVLYFIEDTCCKLKDAAAFKGIACVQGCQRNHGVMPFIHVNI